MPAWVASRLNCTRCHEFTDWEEESEDNDVIRCGECGKRHSKENLHPVDPDKQYDRDEDGNLLETPP